MKQVLLDIVMESFFYRKNTEKTETCHGNVPQVSFKSQVSTRQWKCTISLIRRQNHKGEAIDRSWLCFSTSQTCVKSFTCRLMWADTTKCAHSLITKGIFDWKHALERLRSYGHSMKHIIAWITFSRR